MKRCLRYLARVVAVTALFAVVTGAGAETCKLELKRVDESGEEESQLRYSMMSTSPQEFSMEIGETPGMIDQHAGSPDRPKFSEVIKKEPAKYVAKRPFRGVAKLGSRYYGFVFDAAPEKPSKKKANGKEREGKEQDATDPSKQAGDKSLVVYSRFYFDFNHNGDLTDDKVVEAKEAELLDTDFAYASFPPVDLKIKTDGASMDYAFVANVRTVGYGDNVYVEASFEAAVYRTGELTLGGKKYLVVLADANSNGVFNDGTTVSRTSGGSDDAPGVIEGDRLSLFSRGADSSASEESPAEDELEWDVSGIINLNGGFHDLKVTPAGDELAISPSRTPVGFLTNSDKRFSAIVYGPKGVLRIVSDKEGKARVPEGEWKLLSYEIDRTGFEKLKEPKPKADGKPGKVSTSFLKALFKAVAPELPGGSGNQTLVSAEMTRDYKPVKVTEGKTTLMPFGPPYRPVVSVSYVDPEEGEASLGITLVGSVGEECDYVMVRGRRPGKPKFTITTGDGEEVASGVFEYG